MNYPAIVRVTKTIEEAEKVKSIFFGLEREVKPGQFFMILVPGEDEIPMSVSYATNLEKGITFKVVGRATRKLYEVEEGSVIGVRGPLGNGFSLKGKNILFVGGGT
ncbi:MAG: dihydroorotate dehydrogenase electron transfer subunit, partial [Thermoplasmata archaeon]